jgi:hypothetical protein
VSEATPLRRRLSVPRGGCGRQRQSLT